VVAVNNAQAKSDTIAPLLERGQPLVALYLFCTQGNNRDDASVALPSNLSNNEFRELRGLVRNTIKALG